MTSEPDFEHDPMSLREEVETVYADLRILEHLRATRSSNNNRNRLRLHTNIWLPELFGKYDEETVSEAPVAPPET